jgi:hypothetical protein
MKLVLYRGSFTDDYVAKILEQIPPQIRVTQTTLPEKYSVRGTQYILRIFGSRQTQGNQMVKITFYGSKNEDFMVYLRDLKQFLEPLLQPSLKSAPSSLVPPSALIPQPSWPPPSSPSPPPLPHPTSSSP